MANIDKRPLKAYVRFDGTGRIVPSSLILRRKMPKVGKWAEIPAYECCNDIIPVLYYTPTLPVNYPYLRIFCDDTSVGSNAESGDYTTIADLVEALNADVNFTQFGTYAVGPNGSVKLTPNTATLALCPTGVLSFTIISD